MIESGNASDAALPGLCEAEIARVRPSDVAAMFFTSGNTGNAKGVVHTHATLIDRAGAGARFDKLTADDEVLAYLPPERAVVGAQLAVEYLGERYPVTVAVVGATPLFDPENLRVRG